MKAIRVSRNSEKIFTAGLQDGSLEARLLIFNQVDPMWFDVRGRDRSTGGHADWAHIPLSVGDSFTLEVVDVDASSIDKTRQ